MPRPCVVAIVTRRRTTTVFAPLTTTPFAVFEPPPVMVRSFTTTFPAAMRIPVKTPSRIVGACPELSFLPTIVTAAPANVTIVGRNDSSGQAPTILLGVLTGIRIAAGNVVVNDLTITGGGSNTAKGVVVSGANTVVVLRRVTIATTQGLGIQVDTGASLTVDQCIVKENAIGGLLINGASYKVMNSVFATSGYGVKFNVPKPGSTFVSNTVVGNAGSAVTCDPSTPQMLVGSIVGGFNDSCVLVDSTAQIPPFDTNRPFHLLSPFPCTTDPVGAPAYDIDGDPRTSPIDCGADQFR